MSRAIGVDANDELNDGRGAASAAAGAPEALPASATGRTPLAHVPLLAVLDPVEQQALFATMRVESHEANQTVFWAGDKGGKFYIINRGEIVISVPNDKGEHVHVATLSPGGFFGEISLLDGGPRTASARTTMFTELYALDRADFHKFLQRRPEVAIRILEVMSARQRASLLALRATKNANVVFAATHTGLWQRVSDGIARIAASKHFTLFHLGWFGGWLIVNGLGGLGILPRSWAFDPFPFGLLTMIVSLEAILLSICVMISQNRQSEKDRLRTDLDYQVNVKAQTEIMALHEKMDRLLSQLGKAAE